MGRIGPTGLPEAGFWSALEVPFGISYYVPSRDMIVNPRILEDLPWRWGFPGTGAQLAT